MSSAACGRWAALRAAKARATAVVDSEPMHTGWRPPLKDRLQSERRTLRVGGEGGMKELHKAVEGLSGREDAGPEMVAETIGRFLAED